ncbi:MAG: DUF3261 domain-containing protein [Colwellia sp.]|nr:DUF3261 domain-containing protein [Colwellia sp.]MCW8864270.1 DUF3261 domain-containing protein [Colwellia sp.]MCW9082409.1 DUF3261 domain-containing protein [Colwellia sp.]
MLTRIKQGVLLIITVLIVSACATRTTDIHRVVLDENMSYVLQPIPNHLMNTGIQALFTVKQQGKEKQFLIQVEMTKSHLLVSGMTIEGLSLFNLDWHTAKGKVNYDQKIAIEPLRVLAELQLVLWPVDAISQGLKQGSQEIISQTHREISSANAVIYQIEQQAKISHLINLKHNYSIVIEELERWQLAEDKSVENGQEQRLEQEKVETQL